MSATEPLDSSKKRKISALDEGLSPNIVRCRDLWFEDGTIIIEAENTQFRVHREFVASHSEVFRGMFTFPQPPEDASVDQCRVVHLPDSAKDWEHLLKAMYNCFKTARLSEEYPVERIISLLRLGHKYEFEFFRDIAVQRIKSALEISDGFHSLAYYYVDTQTYLDGHVFELAALLLDTEMTYFLPVVCFMCISENKQTIIKGMKKPDGSISVLPAEVQVMFFDARSRISKDAIRLLLFGAVEALQKAHEENTVACTLRSKACSQISKKITDRVLFLMENPGKVFDVTLDYTGISKCQPCSRFLIEKIRQGRDALWSNLPSYFELPSWAELQI